MKLFLIRHGETISNSEHRFIGATDEELSEEGRAKLLYVKENGIYAIPNMLFVSPMLRCRQSAEILFPNVSYTIIQELKEINFGIFEGKNHAELNENANYQKWIDSGGVAAIQNGESRADFIKRTLLGFRRMLSLTNEEKAAAIVHGGTIMAILSSIYGGDFYDYHVECGEGYECRVNIVNSDTIWLSEVRKIC